MDIFLNTYFSPFQLTRGVFLPPDFSCCAVSGISGAMDAWASLSIDIAYELFFFAGFSALVEPELSG
jgi:hypothetical protein